MNSIKQLLTLLGITIIIIACDSDDFINPTPPLEEPEKIYRIPVVIHLFHHGEPISEGFNLSEKRIQRQTEILNEDFRRQEGTRGWNNRPDGADTRIEFYLAKIMPDGNPGIGIVRMDTSTVFNDTSPQNLFAHFANYSYWPYQHYLNVWVLPFSVDIIDVFLATATGPDTDLPGHERFLVGEPVQPEGILINSWHFGEAAIESPNNLGCTLTHEVGHYLGLLHTWGGGDCENNDYCHDTPPVSGPHYGCATALACDGQPVMIENYMDYGEDACMNIFTKDQKKRMRFVLENSRKDLWQTDLP